MLDMSYPLHQVMSNILNERRKMNIYTKIIEGVIHYGSAIVLTPLGALYITGSFAMMMSFLILGFGIAFCGYIGGRLIGALSPKTNKPKRSRK